MPKLTKRLIDGLKTTERDRNIFDSDLPGFGIRLKPSGARSFFIQYRNASGRSRKLTLGRNGVLTPHEARDMARQKLAAVKRGDDPSKDRKQALNTPNVAQLAERYLEEHARRKKSPRSIESDESLLRLYILPALGHHQVEELARQDVTALHHQIGDKPFQANRVIALLSKMLNLAEKWGIRPDGSNPCRHVERYPEPRRERFLSAEEMTRLGQTLSEAASTGSEHPSVIAAIRLLILTGCRLQEILSLRWENVDFQRGLLWFKESKTGERTIPIGAPALQLLSELPRLEESPFVLAGLKADGHFVALHRPWARIRELAGLDGVRLHDLRHSFASVGAGAGLSLPVIGKLLGHTQAATTQRYAHLSTDPLQQAADRISAEISAAMKGETAEVVELKRG